MLPTEDLFVYVYVLIHDLMAAGHIKVPPRPGPAACSDAELLAIAEVRHLLGRRSEAGFLAEVARDWGHLFPHLPHQSEANRRTRWLWGAFEQLRATLAARLPEDDCQQVDTSALPVKHASRVRRPGRLDRARQRPGRPVRPRRRPRGVVLRLPARRENGPGQPDRARLGHRARRRERARGRRRPAEAGPAPRDLLADKGFSGRAFAAAQAARGTAVLVPPEKKQRASMPPVLQKVIAEWRNRIETTFSEITDRMELARHGAHSFWGLITRTAATIAAHTLLLTCLTEA